MLFILFFLRAYLDIFDPIECDIECQIARVTEKIQANEVKTESRNTLQKQELI